MAKSHRIASRWCRNPPRIKRGGEEEDVMRPFVLHLARNVANLYRRQKLPLFLRFYPHFSIHSFKSYMSSLTFDKCEN